MQPSRNYTEKPKEGMPVKDLPTHVVIAKVSSLFSSSGSYKKVAIAGTL